MVLSAKLGGKISPDKLLDPQNKEFVNFVNANHLQNKMQALGHECWVVPTLGIEGFGNYVMWSSLFKKEIIGPAGKAVGYAFYYQGKEVFQTDLKLKLKSDYCYLNGEISKYMPMNSSEIRHYDTQRGDGRYKIEVWTALHDVEGKRPVITIGDHSHLVLIDDKGKRFGVGQYGMAEDLDCQHALSACGRKKGGIEMPDRYLMMPKNSHNFKKVEITVSKEDFDVLMNQIKEDRVNPSLSVSLIKGNCTSYVRGLLQRIGIRA